MTQRKYVLNPGYVTGSDGKKHYINAAQLADLYGVPMRECVVVGAFLHRDPDGAVNLYPRDDGDYSLPGLEDADGIVGGGQ